MSAMDVAISQNNNGLDHFGGADNPIPLRWHPRYGLYTYSIIYNRLFMPEPEDFKKIVYKWAHIKDGAEEGEEHQECDAGDAGNQKTNAGDDGLQQGGSENAINDAADGITGHFE